ncbi:efflux RND transporter permease subunit [Paenibacillus kribbensis]|uniref:efflux RND transporter permease subunit n=1 Tax=Paenibacillus kribbensis TaxID=172713 RepID=UPI002DBB960C|nr:efflux RND transporter permease subunit [Paenibacillus kribbensis]MEC0236061.1 efflux RND transporter permease subunit [Paenibacillus kribbensis]
MIKYIVKKQKITLIFFGMCIMLGLFNFTSLPKQEQPDVVPMAASVTTVYPGASPERIEQTITKILEQKIKEVQGVKTISSTSSKGQSSISIEAFNDADPTKVWADLRTKVQDAQSELPADAKQPIINDSMTSSFIGSYAITSDKVENLYSLNELMNKWKDQLKTVSGISQVNIQGIPDQEIRISLNTQKMQQYNLSWEQVVQAIKDENDRVPTGSLDFNQRTYQLTVNASTDPNILNNIEISSNEDGFPIYLKDVGTATLVYKKAANYTYVNTKPAISISLSGDTGTDVPTVSKAAAAKINELASGLPKNVHFELLFAQNDRVSEIFGNLTKEMIIAIISVIVVCTLGLNLLTSAFVALAIPVSIAIGFIFLPMTGTTLNQISVIGLIIVLGILVDDAVVVNDNIERRRSEFGEDATQAAIKGTKEVSLSIITATLATVAAFAPLLFLPGNIGDFIKPIPTVISLTMLASMIMSLTIIPIFRQWYDNRRKGKERSNTIKPPGLLGKQIQSLSNVYSKSWMPRILRRPLFTALLGLTIGTATYGLVAVVPIQLFPESDQADATISVTMPEGTSLQATNQVINEIGSWVQKQPETERLSAAAGGGAPQMYSDVAGGGGSGGAVHGQLSVLGKEGVFDIKKTVDRWSHTLQAKYPSASISIRVPQLGIPVGSAVSIRIKGEDIGKLQKMATKVKEIVAGTTGTVDVTDNMGMQSYNLNFQVNQQALDKYKVSYSNLTRTLLLMGDGVNVTDFDTGKELLDINIYMDKPNNDPEVLFQQLTVTNAANEQIPLSQLAAMKPDFSIQQIHRYDLERTVTISANANGRTATELTQDIRSKLANTQFEPGYTWEMGGETSAQSDIFMDLGKLAIIVVFLILLLITMQFYSVSTPLIIMTTVYLAAAGGILGSFISGMPIGFMSIMGIISLAGIVVRNGIVLIEFIEDARREGADLTEAILMACSARFRPILLTSLTAIVGMIPIATIGEVLFKPLATTIIFGLIFSTILTLFVVPTLYMVVANLKLKRKHRKEMRTNSDNSLSL